MRADERTPSESRPTGRMGGFTIIEVLLVLVILSIVVSLAQPTYHRALVRARAVEIYADLDVIQNAVQEFQATYNTWPEDVSRGVVPGGLGDFLPPGFEFAKEGYVLDYDNWTGRGEAPFRIALTVYVDDQELGRALLGMLGNNAWTNGVTKYSWIVEG